MFVEEYKAVLVKDASYKELGSLTVSYFKKTFILKHSSMATISPLTSILLSPHAPSSETYPPPSLS